MDLHTFALLLYIFFLWLIQVLGVGHLLHLLVCAAVAYDINALWTIYLVLAISIQVIINPHLSSKL